MYKTYDIVTQAKPEERRTHGDEEQKELRDMEHQIELGRWKYHSQENRVE